MSKKRINSCLKGKRNELSFVNQKLKPAGLRAWRGAQHAGKAKGGEPAPDVVTPDLPCHWEVKAVERLNIHAAMDQAVADAHEGDLPIVAHKKNGTDFLCTMRADDLISLLKQLFSA